MFTSTAAPLLLLAADAYPQEEVVPTGNESVAVMRSLLEATLTRCSVGSLDASDFHIQCTGHAGEGNSFKVKCSVELDLQAQQRTNLREDSLEYRHFISCLRRRPCEAQAQTRGFDVFLSERPGTKPRKLRGVSSTFSDSFVSSPTIAPTSSLDNGNNSTRLPPSVLDESPPTIDTSGGGVGIIPGVLFVVFLIVLPIVVLVYHIRLVEPPTDTGRSSDGATVDLNDDSSIDSIHETKQDVDT